MRGNMFSQDFETRERARKCMIEYCSKIMTSSYPDLDLTHTQSKESDEKCLGDIIPVDDQVIRNLRHKSKCIDEKGVIAKCNACKQSFTTSKIVNNSLNNWKAKLATEKMYSFQHPISRERSDVYAMLFPYRKISVSKNQSRMQSIRDNYQKTLNLLKFNEHDHYHRKSCFKYGKECRFKIPNQVNEQSYIHYGKETSIWNMLDGNDREVTSFEIMLKRGMGSQYLNTCSLGLSETSGYNSNVQVGDVAHIYYNTLYGSKSTQADDTRGYVGVCTAMTKRIKKQEKEALEEGENVESISHDFTEGLKRILQAIYANISSYIISPTLAHHIVTTGSRFMFSHETKPLLLAQMEDYLYGKNISFTLRPTKGDKKKLWPDSQVYDVIFRPDRLENVCYYEFIEKYKVQNLPPNPDTMLRF